MSDRWTLAPGRPLRGALAVPGDKSVSHRALLFNALASGPARVRGLLGSEDVQATERALTAFGARFSREGADVVVHPPEAGLSEPDDVVDCGNSGTSIRLLAGVAASLPGLTVLTGDASLRRRPMGRVAEPLRLMGARIAGRDGGRLAPLAIEGGDLAPIRYDAPVASAQVKSCVLLAGLRSGVTVREPGQSRDHTERMLLRMGAPLSQDADGAWVLAPTERLDPLDVDVPGDLSAAAFWLVAGAVVPGSEIRLTGVGVNPTRAGVLDALRLMGADLEVTPVQAAGAEPLADIVVRAGGLTGARIDGDLALRCLDELPVLAVAAAFAEGETVIADAAELRVKESDRIARVVAGLRTFGVDVDERPDGMVVQGGRPSGPGRVDATGDHRIAMAFAVAGLAAEQGAVVTGAGSVRSSYPRFLEHLESLRG